MSNDIIQPLNPYYNRPQKMLNKYFSFYGDNGSNENEIAIMKNMQQEQIQIFGVKVTYIVRTSNTVDELYGESASTTFSNSFEIEMFPKDTDVVDGRDSIMPWGYNVVDTLVLQASFDRIVEEFEALGIPDRKYPCAGDLIAFEIPGNIVEIKYVNDRATSMAMNTYALYSFSCQLFDFSNEVFDTGNEMIDVINNYNDIYVKDYVNNDIISQEAEKIIIPEPNSWPSLLPEK